MKEVEPADTGRIIFHAFSEEAGEAEAMFDENENIIGFWSCNDANWRTEYFAPFMEALGFTIVYRKDLEQRVYDEAQERWGPF